VKVRHAFANLALIAFSVFSMTCGFLTTIPLRAGSLDLEILLRRIFEAKDFEPNQLGLVRWLDGGVAYTSIEPSSTTKEAQDIVRHETVSRKSEVVVSAAQLVPTPGEKPLLIEDYAWSKNQKRLLIFANAHRVWRRNTRGDYWVFELKSKKLQKLGGDAASSSLMFAKFSPDGLRVAYVRNNNIFVEDLSSGMITPLTTDGCPTTINGTSDWVYEEEFDLRDAFRWSPDGRSIAYWQFDTGGVENFALIDDTDSTYPRIKYFPYPFPGTTNSAVRVGVVSANGGATRWMQVPGDLHDAYIARMEWAENSDELVLECLNRAQNTNDVLLADTKTGEVRRIFEDRDAAWVELVDSVRWFHGGDEFLWLSERDGWRHAYAVSRNGNNVRLVTKGDFDVVDVQAIDPSGEWLYYRASPENATQRYLYRVPLSGTGRAERLTPGNTPGTHSYDISPDCRWALHTWSGFDTPPTIDLIRLPDHRVERVVEENASLKANFASLPKLPTKFFHLDIGRGVVLDGWMIKPFNFDPSAKYPLLLYVYGEPAEQAVLDVWSTWNSDLSLFHRAVANEGYLVACVDNRGTPAPKGRAWRKIIYGSIGVLSSSEQAAAVRELAKSRSYVDAARVAVWGWSGGGSNTLNLMFRSPDVFKVGIAVAPVPDQRLYDSIYQERFMGLPQQNVDGYQQGSPINFAQGLRGSLLIIHGSGDDNVHFQGSELLINRLIELGKSFDMMDYPNRTHRISEGKGTSLHLYSLMARYLEEHLPAGPRH
jgi:dipeptidyl-peptidase 4